MGRDRPFITLVTGLPRSGTSLAMQMLAAGGLPVLTDADRPPDEDNPRGYYELSAVKATARDASWIAEASGRAVKVIHALIGALPGDRDYHAIVMRRAIAEVMRSQAAMLARAGKASTSDDGAALAVAMESQLEEVVAAMRENERFAVLEIAYTDLVAAPAAWAGRMDAFLGGGLDVSAMAAAVDPALYRNRASWPDPARPG